MTFLTARWEHLLMLNFEIEPAVLAADVPAGTELDTWRDRCFISLIGFRFLDTRVKGVAIPGYRNFEEINLRFYVRHRAAEGWRRGVVFIREVVPRFAIAAVARWLYNENYVACPTRSSLALPTATAAGGVSYSWRAGTEWLSISAAISGEPQTPADDQHATFISEHYWGYSAQRDGSSVEYQVEHPRWRVWPATEVERRGDLAGFYGERFRHSLTGEPVSVFVADGSAVTVHRGEAC